MKKKTEKSQVIFRTQTQHCDSNYADLEKLKVLTTHSKNLFNSIHYILRQVFISLHKLKSHPQNYLPPEAIRLIFTLNDFISELCTIIFCKANRVNSIQSLG